MLVSRETIAGSDQDPPSLAISILSTMAARVSPRISHEQLIGLPGTHTASRASTVGWAAAAGGAPAMN